MTEKYKECTSVINIKILKKLTETHSNASQQYKIKDESI